MISIEQPLTLDEVRDFHTYPLLMHRLMECSQPENDLDYIVLVLHALMLESGYQMVRKTYFPRKTIYSFLFFRMRIMIMI